MLHFLYFPCKCNAQTIPTHADSGQFLFYLSEPHFPLVLSAMMLLCEHSVFQRHALKGIDVLCDRGGDANIFQEFLEEGMICEEGGGGNDAEPRES